MGGYGYIKNGKLYPGKPPTPQAPNSQYKAADHDKQRREFAADIVQPYDSSGHITPEFAWLYPDQAELYKNGGR